MAKNTGRGSRAGAFKGVHDERPWDQQHPLAAAVAIVAPVTGLFVLLALLIVEAGL
jgi:hypothetical protein